MLQYEYRPLDSSKNEIRIIRFPAVIKSDESVVSCTIQHVSLDWKCLSHEGYSFTNGVRLLPDRSELITIDGWRNHGEQTSILDDPHKRTEKTIPMLPRYTWGDFEAVSYCWESDVRDKAVLVDSCVVWVPQNLEAMLRELRKLPEAVSGIGFWIDGLCINQANILEKNHQVSMMQRLYSEALSTVVWLGPSTEGTNEAIEIFKTLHNIASASEATVAGGSKMVQIEPLPSFSGLQWTHVLELWSRNYFKRMWIIQELALNKRLTMFMCGEYRITRDELRKGTDWAREHAGAVSRAVSKDVHAHSLPNEVDHDLVWLLADHVANLIRLSESPSIDHVFNLARRSQATDPRDKVYGMLGLANEKIASFIKPDYSKSVEQVYTEFAVGLIRSCQKLDEVLSWCVFDEGATLPSWVPDWRIAHQRNHIQWLRSRGAGSYEYGPIWSLQDGGKVLVVKGIKVDQVESTSRSTSNSLPYRVVNQQLAASPHGKPTFGRYLSKPLLKMSLELTLLQDHPHRFELGDLTDIPWVRWNELPENSKAKHLLELIPGVTDQWKIFDRFRQSNADFDIFGHPFSDFFPNSSEYIKDLVQTEIDPISIDEFSMEYGVPSADARSLKIGGIKHGFNTHTASNLRRAAVALQNRCLFTTRTGFLGLAPEESRAGDFVAVLLGCNHPVVLRPHKDHFLYIGECFVHGMMDGEVIAHAERGGKDIDDELEDISIA